MECRRRCALLIVLAADVAHALPTRVNLPPVMVSGMLPLRPLTDAVSFGLPDAVWPQALGFRTSPPLQIVVLGASPTAGCNACDTAGYNATQDPRCPNLKHCNPAIGWAGQLKERLAALLPTGAQLDEVAVHGKNAVGPSFFSKCTSKFVPAGKVIVLIELATNLWAWGSDFRPLLDAVYRASPTAAVAFVSWVSRKDFQRAAAAGHHTPKALYEAGPGSRRADMLHVSVPLYRVLQQPPFNGTLRTIYSDSVHPTALGHALLAELAARFVANRIAPNCVHVDGALSRDAASCRMGEDGHEQAEKRDASSALIPPPPPLPLPLLPPVAVEKDVVWEWCAASADSLPVVANSTSGWQLVDDAKGSGKGSYVRKMGLVSHSARDVLTLGPLDGPPGARCATLEATLGYLSRPSRVGSLPQGALWIHCNGCACVHAAGPFWQKTDPFPLVQTDAYRAKLEMLRDNISVTATTSFLMAWRRSVPCHVRVTHRGPAQSRVLVSSLTLSSQRVAMNQVKWAGRVCSKLNKYGSACTTAMEELSCERSRYATACTTSHSQYSQNSDTVKVCKRITNFSMHLT